MGDAPKAGAQELHIAFDGWTRHVALDKADVVLGRSSDCDVSLPDPTLSRQHCRISRGSPGELIVQDLGSQAGTLLNGMRLTAPRPLRPADRLQIGATVVRVRPRSAASVLSGDPARDQRNIELLLETVGDLHGTDSTDELLRTIVDRAIAIADGERGALLLGGRDAPLEAAVSRDAAGHDLPAEEVLTRSLPSRAVETGRAVVLDRADTPEQRRAVPESVIRSGLQSVLCVPLPGSGGQIGVLYVDSSRPTEEVGPADLAILKALAAQGALAIERARLREVRQRSTTETRRRLEAENAALKSRIGPALIGESPPMQALFEMVRRFAPVDATVLLRGETGTGKELLARALHAQSRRASGPFVVIDCGAIPPTLIESELFGHQPGSFTGATAARKGLFREADGGTVLLDEIGELPLEMQTRLLRVLQEHTVQPVGASSRVPVDVRILCATHRDLAQRVADGGFREDLYYRVSLLTIAIPPLRERGQDVLLLARQFLARFAATHGIGVTDFTREAVEALLAHGWPGNVRELEHRVQRAVLLAEPPVVSRRDLGLGDTGEEERASEADLPLPPLQDARAKATDRFERAYLEDALRRANGSATRAAELADVSEQLFRRLLKRHGIDRQRFVKTSDA